MGWVVPAAQILGGAVTGSFAGASAFGTAASVIGGLGSAASLIGGLASSNADSQAAEFNARVQQQNAVRTQQQAQENARRQRTINARNIGTLIAERGASGLQSFEGNALDIINDSLVQGELLAQDIESGGAVAANDFQAQSRLLRSSASNNRVGAALSAGGKLLTAIPSIGKSLNIG